MAKQAPPPPGLEHVYVPKAPAKKGTVPYKTWAKDNFLVLLRNGYNYSQAAERIGTSYRWWAVNNKADPVWGEKARAIVSGEVLEWTYPDLSRMSFEEFCRLYAGFTFAPHQVEIAAALEDPLGKVVLVLGHPESGKSTQVALGIPCTGWRRTPIAV